MQLIFLYIFLPVLSFPAIFESLIGDDMRMVITISASLCIAILSILSRYRVAAVAIQLFAVLNIISIEIIYQYSTFLYAPLLGILAAFYIKNKLNEVVNVLYVFYVLNFITIIISIFIGIDIQVGRSTGEFYNNGIFGYAKSTAEFILISLLWVRNYRNVLFITFPSAVFSGVRAAWLGVGFFIVMNYLSKNKSQSREIIKSTIIIIIAIITYAYLNSQEYIQFHRTGSLLNLESRSYYFRYEMWQEHLNCFISLPILNVFLGSRQYCSSIIGNGAENHYISLFNYYGLIFSLIYFMIMFFIVYKIITDKKFRKYFWPILVIFLVSMIARMPMAFVSWMLIASLLLLYYEKNFKYLDKLIFTR